MYAKLNPEILGFFRELLYNESLLFMKLWINRWWVVGALFETNDGAEKTFFPFFQSFFLQKNFFPFVIF